MKPSYSGVRQTSRMTWHEHASFDGLPPHRREGRLSLLVDAKAGRLNEAWLAALIAVLPRSIATSDVIVVRRRHRARRAVLKLPEGPLSLRTARRRGGRIRC